MKYIWVLKYILYCTFSKRNIIAAYQEGGVFGCLLAFPFMSFFTFIGQYNINVLYFIGFLIFAFEVAITWDYDKVMRRYHKFDLDRWQMEKELTIVRWAIAIDLAIFIMSIFFRVGIRKEWF